MAAEDEFRSAPKRLQKQRPIEAVRVYAERYRDALAEGDEFLASLYMDELLACIFLSHGEDRDSRGLAPTRVRDEARGVLWDVQREQDRPAIDREEVAVVEDLDIAIWKRYPDELRKDENLELP